MRVKRVGDGRPVVFLHPALLDHRYWGDVVGMAPRGVCCWLVDLPDHVEDEPDFGLARTEDVVDELLASVPTPFTLVGASFGGYLAARVAPRLGPAVQRLILQGALASVPSEMAEAYGALADAIESGAADLRQTVQTAVRAAAGPAASDEVRRRLHAMTETWPGPRVVRSLRRTAEIAGRPATRTLTVPTVVLHARDDASVPLELGQELAALAPSADVRVLDTGGHCLAMTEPELVAATVFAA